MGGSADLTKTLHVRTSNLSPTCITNFCNIMVIYFDISNAFDTVYYTFQPRKKQTYDLSPRFSYWIQIFLFNNQIMVVFNSFLSACFLVKSHDSEWSEFSPTHFPFVVKFYSFSVSTTFTATTITVPFTALKTYDLWWTPAYSEMGR